MIRTLDDQTRNELLRNYRITAKNAEGVFLTELKGSLWCSLGKLSVETIDVRLGPKAKIIFPNGVEYKNINLSNNSLTSVNSIFSGELEKQIRSLKDTEDKKKHIFDFENEEVTIYDIGSGTQATALSGILNADETGRLVGHAYDFIFKRERGQHQSLKKHLADFSKLQLPPNSADLIYSANAFEELSKRNKCGRSVSYKMRYRTIANCLKHGGKALLQDSRAVISFLQKEQDNLQERWGLRTLEVRSDCAPHSYTNPHSNLERPYIYMQK